MTISLDEHVYDELCRAAGPRKIGYFIESLLRPHLPHDLEASYRDMAADHQREAETIEWLEGVSEVVVDRER